MPHWTTIPAPYDEKRVSEPFVCPKCGAAEPPLVSYQKAHTIYSACDMHYPEAIDLACRACGYSEWMRPKDWTPPPLKPPSMWLKDLAELFWIQKKVNP
jgi:predicted nucleic-acid-binding Zn-ribbon protein